MYVDVGKLFRPADRGGFEGGTVKSLVVYLSVVMFLPYGRIDNFFREVFGLEISQGSFVNWVDEAKKNAEPVIEKIKECIMKSAVIGFDESGLYCNKNVPNCALPIFFLMYI